MITLKEARQRVVIQLGRPEWLSPDDEWVVIDEATIEKPWGWVFFYTSKLWQETGEVQHAVGGNAPLIVERKAGRILATGTAYAIEHYIANYERSGNPNG
ncbi:YrhB domain-containing protein [Roseateles terrae]|uniref:Immunity protein 35 domain-containing protein n=1 Tax=Roseateles terrae TaxID=431060 RepID=A0ABR6GPQ6_9BURK|nr:YrhB domain-containing protein [Roseateles terrae]MBB3194088.1 hypothetical protein [Roseateles terrae]